MARLATGTWTRTATPRRCRRTTSGISPASISTHNSTRALGLGTHTIRDVIWHDAVTPRSGQHSTTGSFSVDEFSISKYVRTVQRETLGISVDDVAVASAQYGDAGGYFAGNPHLILPGTTVALRTQWGNYLGVSESGAALVEAHAREWWAVEAVGAGTDFVKLRAVGGSAAGSYLAFDEDLDGGVLLAPPAAVATAADNGRCRGRVRAQDQPDPDRVSRRQGHRPQRQGAAAGGQDQPDVHGRLARHPHHRRAPEPPVRGGAVRGDVRGVRPRAHSSAAGLTPATAAGISWTHRSPPRPSSEPTGKPCARACPAGTTPTPASRTSCGRWAITPRASCGWPHTRPMWLQYTFPAAVTIAEIAIATGANKGSLREGVHAQVPARGRRRRRHVARLHRGCCQ